MEKQWLAFYKDEEGRWRMITREIHYDRKYVLKRALEYKDMGYDVKLVDIDCSKNKIRMEDG